MIYTLRYLPDFPFIFLHFFLSSSFHILACIRSRSRLFIILLRCFLSTSWSCCSSCCCFLPLFLRQPRLIQYTLFFFRQFLSSFLFQLYLKLPSCFLRFLRSTWLSVFPTLLYLLLSIFFISVSDDHDCFCRIDFQEPMDVLRQCRNCLCFWPITQVKRGF